MSTLSQTRHEYGVPGLNVLGSYLTVIFYCILFYKIGVMYQIVGPGIYPWVYDGSVLVGLAFASTITFVVSGSMNKRGEKMSPALVSIIGASIFGTCVMFIVMLVWFLATRLFGIEF